jgi:hypothetical protein
MVPLRIDIANVAPDSVARLKAEYSAPRQFDGGCNVIDAARTKVGGEKGIVAQDIKSGHGETGRRVARFDMRRDVAQALTPPHRPT